MKNEVPIMVVVFKHRGLSVRQSFTATLISCTAVEEATETCGWSVHSHRLNLICAKAGLGNPTKNKNRYLGHMLARHYYNQKPSSKTASSHAFWFRELIGDSIMQFTLPFSAQICNMGLPSVHTLCPYRDMGTNGLPTNTQGYWVLRSIWDFLLFFLLYQ